MESRQPDESGELRPNLSTEPAASPQPETTQPNVTEPPAEPAAADELPALINERPVQTTAEQTPELSAEQRNGQHETNGVSARNGDERNGSDDRPQNTRNDRAGGDAAFRLGQRNDRENRNREGRGRSDGELSARDTNGRDTNRNRPGVNRERADEPRDAVPRERNPRNGPEREAQTRDSGSSDGQSAEYPGREDRLVIGISLGDYNGIGPEVILKALQYNRLQKICTPVIYGSMRVLNRYRNLLNLKDWNLNGAPTIHQISHKLTNVITCWPDQNQDIQPGQVTPEAGQAAFACLQRAVDDLKDGRIDALVTAPINKYNIQSEEFKFPGHTEYLAEQFGVTDNLMFMVSETLRVGVVTGHVPLGRVRQNVTRDRIAQKLTLMMQSLKQDFGLEKPKIAVLGLNPHAGEEGLLGNEEQDIIKPLLAEWRNKGQLVFGPYPADGFFGTRSYAKFDAVLAMYHDQGLIPFKAIAFEEGVNFTAGMPVVRTSPDHGTAYDIAGKGIADETSMLQAIYTAIDVARQRKEYVELEANALK